MRLKHIRNRNVNSILLYDGKLMGHVLNNHEKKTECFNRNAFKSSVCNRTLADGARTPWDKV